MATITIGAGGGSVADFSVEVGRVSADIATVAWAPSNMIMLAAWVRNVDQGVGAVYGDDNNFVASGGSGVGSGWSLRMLTGNSNTGDGGVTRTYNFNVEAHFVDDTSMGDYAFAQLSSLVPVNRVTGWVFSVWIFFVDTANGIFWVHGKVMFPDDGILIPSNADSDHPTFAALRQHRIDHGGDPTTLNAWVPGAPSAIQVGKDNGYMLYARARSLPASPVAITGATNATPIHVTAPSHGFAAGDVIGQAGIVGSVAPFAANGTFRVANPTTNAYDLHALDGSNVAGNGTYTSGGFALKLPSDAAILALANKTGADAGDAAFWPLTFNGAAVVLTDAVGAHDLTPAGGAAFFRGPLGPLTRATAGNAIGAPTGMSTFYGDGNDGIVIKATVASGVVTADKAVGTTTGVAGVDILSRVIDFRRFFLLALQPIVTGDVAGDWAIEWSNDYSPGAQEGRGQPTNAGDWSIESPAVIPAPAGSGQLDNVEIAFRAFRDVRFRFTPSGGSGTAELRIFCKG